MTDGPDFPPSSNLAFVIAIGVVSYFSTLAVCANWLRFSKRDWKRLDYVWLSFAVVGVIGTVSNVRRQVAPSLVEWHTATTSASLANVRSAAEHLSSTTYCRSIAGALYTREDIEQLQRDYDAVCRFGAVVDSLARDSAAAEFAVQIRAQRPRVVDSSLERVLVQLDTALSQLASDRNLLEAARSSEDLNTFEFILGILSPFLVAFALGLRFAKVTGELRVEV